jgi:hypothetical protein
VVTNSAAWRLGFGGTGVCLIGGVVALVAAVRLPLVATGVTPSGALVVSRPSFLSAPVAESTASPAPHGGLFRPSRAAAPVPFEPLGNPLTTPAVEPQPAFALVGLVLGPARSALIRGIPGQEAAQVLAEGDQTGGAYLVRIEAAGVVLVWRGDTLRLALPKEER